jgi:hypothetical protein
LSRVAIVHPRLIAMGGAERVIEALAVLYPQADIFVLSSEPKMVPLSLRDHKIYTSFLNDIPWIRKVYDRLMFLYPVAIEAFDLSAYDLVISSAGPAVFGVNVSQDALHVCYCHSPERTWWEVALHCTSELSTGVGVRSRAEG